MCNHIAKLGRAKNRPLYTKTLMVAALSSPTPPDGMATCFAHTRIRTRTQPATQPPTRRLHVLCELLPHDRGHHHRHRQLPALRQQGRHVLVVVVPWGRRAVAVPPRRATCMQRTFQVRHEAWWGGEV